MTKNNKLNNQEELFARDCKLMNLKYEYDGYTGTEKWAVVTELTEEELWDKYPDIISRYTPFVLLSMAQGKVIIDNNRETHRCEMRDVLLVECLKQPGVESTVFRTNPFFTGNEFFVKKHTLPH